MLAHADETLEARLSRGRLPVGVSVDIAVAVGRELADAHGRGAVHGDLSPASVVFTADETAHVRDMPRGRRITQELAPAGNPTLAALEELAQNRTHARKAEALMGQLAYKSPEQLRGELIDAADDVFALGAIVYEMLSGQRAFPGHSRAELTREIVLAKPKALEAVAPDVPTPLVRVVEKALAAKREARYPTMTALVADLETARPPKESKPALAVSVPAVSDTRKRPTASPPPVVREKRRSLPVALSIAAVLIVAAAAIFYVRRGGPHVDVHTVLIVPMDVRGQNEGSAYLGRAFAEAIAVNLALGGRIKVLPVPEPAELGAGAMDRAKAGRDHGAARMLTGAVTRDGEQLQASVNLIDTVENHIVWGTSATSPSSDLSALALELSRDVASQMGAALPRLYDYIGNLTGGPVMARAPETSLALGAIRAGDVPRALDATSRLVIGFPNELAAHALRCQALLLAWDADPSFENGQRLRQAMDALEAIDPENPYSAFYRAYLAYGRGDMKTALDLFANIVERDDLSPAARAWVMRYRALVLGVTGDKARSLAVLEEALAIDPANAWTVASLSETLGELDRPHDALERAQQAVALNPGSWRNYVTLGLSFDRLSRFEEASAAFTSACQNGKSQFACALQAVALQHAGHKSEAAATAESAAKLTDSTWGTYNLACYYAIAGDMKQAIAYLSRAVDLGFPNTSFETDPDFQALRGTADLQKLSALVRQRNGQ